MIVIQSFFHSLVSQVLLVVSSYIGKREKLLASLQFTFRLQHQLQQK